jgi:hypothetical protein
MAVGLPEEQRFDDLADRRADCPRSIGGSARSLRHDPRLDAEAKLGGGGFDAMDGRRQLGHSGLTDMARRMQQRVHKRRRFW